MTYNQVKQIFEGKLNTEFSSSLSPVISISGIVVNESDIQWIANFIQWLMTNFDSRSEFIFVDDKIRDHLRRLHFQTHGLSDFAIRKIFSICLNAVSSTTETRDVFDSGYATIKNGLNVDIINIFKFMCEASDVPFVNSYSRKICDGTSLTKGWKDGSLPREFFGRNTVNLIKHNQNLLRDYCVPALQAIYELVQSPDTIATCEKIIGISSGYLLHIIDVYLMYSFPGSHDDSHAAHAMKYHADYHGPAFCKIFIPITPFDKFYGTHSFVTTSHRVKPNTYQDSNKEFNSLLNDYDHSLFLDHHSHPGDVIIENTNGYHCGKTGMYPRIILAITVGFLAGT